MRRRFCWEATNFQFLIYTSTFNGNLPNLPMEICQAHLLKTFTGNTLTLHLLSV